MFYLVIRHDHPDVEQLRVELKQPHRAFLASLGKKLVTGGAIFDDSGNVIGGTITFEAQSLDDARRVAQSDPYAQHPLIGAKTTIVPFRARWKDGVFYDGDGYSTRETPPVPNFKTERLLLTALKIDDATAYQKHFVDYEVIRHLSAQVPWPYPENGVIEFFKHVLLPPQGIDRWTWAISLKTNPAEIIGCIDLWREGRPENRGFWLGKKFWGHGYMTEAVEPSMDYAFNSLGFETLTFANAVGNDRSRRVKEKTGAKLVAVKPAAFVDPRYTEQEIWELKKASWEAFKEHR